MAFPTETVWGLAADSASAGAVAALRRWKGRDAAQPLSVLIAEPGELAELSLVAGAAARALAHAFWPGPLTLVLPQRARGARATGAVRFAAGIARDDGAVGVRCSPHPLARALAAAARSAGCGFPTATSCNRAGDPAAVNLAAARRVCGDAADAPWVLEPGVGEDAGGGAPSSVLELCGGGARLLRAGAIARAELERVLGAPIDAAHAGDERPL